MLGRSCRTVCACVCVCMIPRSPTVCAPACVLVSLRVKTCMRVRRCVGFHVCTSPWTMCCAQHAHTHTHTCLVHSMRIHTQTHTQACKPLQTLTQLALLCLHTASPCKPCPPAGCDCCPWPSPLLARCPPPLPPPLPLQLAAAPPARRSSSIASTASSSSSSLAPALPTPPPPPSAALVLSDPRWARGPESACPPATGRDPTSLS